jgi:hypothetical protein
MTLMDADMEYDGKILKWQGQRYKATSGMPGYQRANNSCISDSGPIPEGLYYVFLADKGEADTVNGRCKLKPSWGMQTIPRGADAGRCEPYFANWGRNRVRLEAANKSTRNRCAPLNRRGFYLHDSTKGFSHGCIEVEASLFSRLRSFRSSKHKDRLILKVNYPSGGATYGGTRQ